MNDNGEPIVGINRLVVVAGPAPDDGWAKVRCAGCGREATLPIETLPPVPDALRDDDGVRLAYCPKCIPPDMVVK